MKRQHQSFLCYERCSNEKQVDFSWSVNQGQTWRKTKIRQWAKGHYVKMEIVSYTVLTYVFSLVQQTHLSPTEGICSNWIPQPLWNFQLNFIHFFTFQSSFLELLNIKFKLLLSSPPCFSNVLLWTAVNCKEYLASVNSSWTPLTFS